MSGNHHLQDLKATYTAYEPYLDSSSSGTSSSASSRSVSSLSAAEQEKLIAALKGLHVRTHDALLALCCALDIEGRRTDPDAKVQALMVQAWSGLNRTKKLRFWRRNPLCAFPSSLETVLGGVAWSVGGDMRGSFLQCVFALYASSDLENSGGVALTTSSFAMMWRTAGGVQLECSRHWAEWLEGRRVSLIDLLENGDFWESAPFRWQNSHSEINRLLAFVDARHCPFQPIKMHRRPTAARPKLPKAAASLLPEKSESALVKRMSVFSALPRVDYDTGDAHAAAHVDKTLVKRIKAVLPSSECEAYVDLGMPDPRVIAAAFANLTVEFRHWA
ncbi:hypothetical protein A1Q1_05300 [Trichosporon asahii var. asahii CBS 2479]|uniref:Uncharacterized protein n=1 Tax=Trichosporon asahii var. asahii (strain ATCC 90039 / CBS 2479 / JCM 2466 / KCTC 7840 / NBRC 103889/ NCYC 2677 / UAMH 7654) TaxID=1186058 RepID=J6EP48_TRIAS|nr:hypothetical protein A1Q1_05300 [Trichosporon asahii var. asahii CBS 2479]EJT46179.1 hypothetical protein A1Q1_05300 [Trichosporon asahii var. asahii CBS 2479]